MSQAGFTPIKLYYSTTAAAVPSAGNLDDGELALNIADMKLYAKNGSGAVTLLASSASAATTGTVTTVSVASANGLAGTVANASTTPAITLSTTVTGLLKGNGTAISAATSGTDYAPATSGTSILYGNGSGGFSNVTIGTNLSFSGGTLSVTAAGAPSTTTYTNQSANVTLTSADANTLITFTLANDVTVTLPDATTLSSAKNFILKNNSEYFGLIINNSAGTYLFSIPPSSGMYFWTTSTATAAGAWVSQNIPLPYMPYNWTSFTPYLGGNSLAGLNTVAALTSTTAVVLTFNSYRLKVSIATNSGGTITYNTPIEIPSGQAISTAASVCALTSTSGIIVFGYGTNSAGLTSPHAVGFTVSGSTITLGTVIALDLAYYTSGYGFNSLAAMSSTDATLVYSRGDTVFAQNLVLSGSTVSAPVGASSFASQVGAGSFLGVRALTSTTAVVVCLNSAGNINSFVITNSSGTYSKGATVTQTLGSPASQASLTVFTATSFAFVYSSASNVSAIAATISGTTITLGSPVFLRNNGDSSYVSLAATSNNTAVAFYDANNTGMQARAFTVSGTTINLGSAYTVDVALASLYVGLVALQAPNVAAPNSSNLLARFDHAYNYATYCEALSISGTVITSNTTAVAYRAVYANTLTKHTIDALSPSQFVYIEQVAPSVSPTAAQGSIVANLFSATGSTPTLLSSVVAVDSTAADSQAMSICALNSTTAIVVFKATPNSNIRAVLLTVSGSTISAQPSVAVDTGGSFDYVSVSRVSDTQAFVAYVQNGTPNLYVRSLNVSGTTITVSARDTLSNSVPGISTASSITTAVLSSTSGLVGVTGNGPTTFIIGVTISSSFITWNAAAINGYSSMSYPDITPLSSDKALLITTPNSASGGGANFYVLQLAPDGYNITNSVQYLVRPPFSSNPYYGYAVATKSRDGVVSGVVSLGFSNSWQNNYFALWSVNSLGISIQRYEPYTGQGYGGNYSLNGQITAMQTPAISPPNASSVVIAGLPISNSGVVYETATSLRKIYLTGATN